MTAISLGQPVRPSRLGMRAVTAAIKGGRLSRDSGRYLVGPAQLREQFEWGILPCRPRDFAGGFFFFPWGRAAPHPQYLFRRLSSPSAGAQPCPLWSTATVERWLLRKPDWHRSDGFCSYFEPAAPPAALSAAFPASVISYSMSCMLGDWDERLI